MQNNNEKVCKIIAKEFLKEILAKEKEILEIDNRIILVRKLLHRVRYAIANLHYNKKKNIQTLNQFNDSNHEFANEYFLTQTAIHPSLKKILNTKSDDYKELMKVLPKRQAAKAAKCTIKEKLKTLKEKRLDRLKKTDDEIGSNSPSSSHCSTSNLYSFAGKFEKPMATLNDIRIGSQTKHLIVVGNTSKFVGHDISSDVTHKWLIYVRTKTPCPIEQLVYKVRFFLHPSFKPNDVVDVNSVPFQLSRRGWGEFPVRIQLFFHSYLQQKPIQVLHNLKLDKKLSGIQTIGAETVVELWLRLNHLNQSSNDEKQYLVKNSEDMNETASFLPTEKNFDYDALNYLNYEGDSLIPFDVDNTELSLIPPKNSLDNFNLISDSKDSDIKGTNMEDIKFILPDLKEIDNKLTDNIKHIDNKFESNVKKENNINNSPNFNKSLKRQYETLPIIQDPVIYNKNLVVLKNGKMYIVDPIKNKIGNASQESLLKPKKYNVEAKYNRLLFDHNYASCSTSENSTISKPLNSHKTKRKLYICQKRNFNEVNMLKIFGKHIVLNINKFRCINTQKKDVVIMQKPREDYCHKFEANFLNQNFTDPLKAIQYLFQKLPLINKMATESAYKESFPFLVSSCQQYHNFSPPKKMACEWLQAKYFSKLMQSHQVLNETFWTTKEIILYGRSHAYYPIMSNSKNSTAQMFLKNYSSSNNKIINDFYTIDRIDKFIHDKSKEVEHNLKKSEDLTLDIENLDSNYMTKNKLNSISMNIKNNNTDWLSIDQKYESENIVVQKICHDLGYLLQPEEIVNGVMHDSAKLVLIIALRTFIEDLTRRSFSQKLFEKDFFVELLTCKHIQNVIISQSKFKFLSGKY